MTSTAEKLLERLRSKTTGWVRRDLEKILRGHGFTGKTRRHGVGWWHPSDPAGTYVLVARDRQAKQYTARNVLIAVEKVARPGDTHDATNGS